MIYKEFFSVFVFVLVISMGLVIAQYGADSIEQENQLKEVGNGNETRLAYEIQIERHSRILGIFQAKMKIRTQVDAENGEIIDINKPWWAFIATEPAEE